MNITIKALTTALSADYFDFFENRAFTDNSPYRCYCQVYQMSKEQAKIYENIAPSEAGRASREIAEKQIDSGALSGYLAFDDGLAIGWCNANDKSNFPVEPYIGESFYAPAEMREKAVVCFEIAPEYRGKGIATALLQRVLDDAKADGYTAVHAYPVARNERYEWDCTGPVRLYEKLGFVKISENGEKTVMRKEVEN